MGVSCGTMSSCLCWRLQVLPSLLKRAAAARCCPASLRSSPLAAMAAAQRRAAASRRGGGTRHACEPAKRLAQRCDRAGSGACAWRQRCAVTKDTVKVASESGGGSVHLNLAARALLCGALSRAPATDCCAILLLGKFLPAATCHYAYASPVYNLYAPCLFTCLLSTPLVLRRRAPTCNANLLLLRHCRASSSVAAFGGGLYRRVTVGGGAGKTTAGGDAAAGLPG